MRLHQFMMATILILASAFAISMPKNEAVWEDPMPGIRQVLGLSGSGGSVQRIGYGTNDETKRRFMCRYGRRKSVYLYKEAVYVQIWKEEECVSAQRCLLKHWR